MKIHLDFRRLRCMVLKEDDPEVRNIEALLSDIGKALNAKGYKTLIKQGEILLLDNIVPYTIHPVINICYDTVAAYNTGNGAILSIALYPSEKEIHHETNTT